MNQKIVFLTGLFVGALGGWLLSMGVESKPDSAEVLAIPAPQPPTLVKTECPEPIDLKKRLDAAERLSAFQAAVIRTLQPLEPLYEWNEDVPKALTRDGFGGILDDAIRNCDMSWMNVQELECDIPPCLAVIRVSDRPEDASTLMDCPPFANAFPDGISGTSVEQDCEGRSERLLVISGHLPGILLDEQALQDRRDTLVEDWSCR